MPYTQMMIDKIRGLNHRVVMNAVTLQLKSLLGINFERDEIWLADDQNINGTVTHQTIDSVVVSCYTNLIIVLFSHMSRTQRIKLK